MGRRGWNVLNLDPDAGDVQVHVLIFHGVTRVWVLRGYLYHSSLKKKNHKNKQRNNRIWAGWCLFSWGRVDNLFLFHELEEENGKPSRGHVRRDEQKQKVYFPSGSSLKSSHPPTPLQVPKLGGGISKDCLIDFSPI